MQIDLGTAFVTRVIAHQIPRNNRRDPRETLDLSDTICPAPTEVRNHLKERITTSLATAAFSVEPDPTSTSPVPGHIHRFLGDPQTLVPASQEMARHLHNCQTGQSPAGLLCVAELTVAGQLGVAVLKLEMESAVHMKMGAVDGGGRTLDLQILDKLVLHKGTRVFKIGVFVADGALGTFKGIVSDKQRGEHPSKKVASFFLEDFLGCRIAEDPRLTTQRFFMATETFINEQVIDPVRRAKYQVALVAEIDSHAPTISAAAFAHRHLDVADRQTYEKHLSQSNVPSTGAFQKDTELVASRIRRIAMTLQSGVQVVGRPEVIDQNVKQTSLEDGRVRLEMEDYLKSVQGTR